MKIVTKPENKVIVQLRAFRRNKNKMNLSGSKTITLHDAELEDIYRRLSELFAKKQDEALAS